ncbi:alpha/beta hydrolase [Nocardia sp. JMUB6875]|uniref:WXG100-like domain-containing protein n=1 Tax=Nocardia sp. JMUB6875 TaxID=3158170 RepID=UPI0034E83F73
MSWLVGSEWPHGNEDTMWQMARDLESVAGQADDLLTDLDHLLGALGKAYPDGTGGEEIIKWLKPLRYGDDSGHGSVKEFGDNYRQLATAADGFGDQLQSAKLNFYIAGAWLVAEMAWAAATGPFAPESEAIVITAARTAFRELGEMFVRRIESLIANRITSALLREILPKLIYEIGQGAVISTVQAATQELLVQSIQNMNGHGHGFDLAAIGKNSLVAGLSGGVGGATGFGMHRALPTDMGGWKGAFNGMLTGGTAGVTGAGAAWLGNGLVNGQWDFDPRSLTGGAFAGAGPSGLHGYNGETNHNGVMGRNTGDGSTHVPGENGTRPATFDHPGTTTDGRAPGADTNGNGHNTTGDPGTGQHGSPADTKAAAQHDTTGDPRAEQPHGTIGDPGGNGQQGNTGDSTGAPQNGDGQQPGGPHMHSTSAPTAGDTAPVDHGHDQSTDRGDSTRSDNNTFTSDGRRERPDANAQDTGGTTDSTSHRSADTHSVSGDRTADTTTGDSTRADSHGAPEHRAGDATTDRDATGRTHDTGTESRAPESTSERTADPVKDTNSNPVVNYSADGNTHPAGDSGKGAANPNSTPAHETRAPADPAKAGATPRDLPRVPADGSAPRPTDSGAPRPTDGTAPRPADGGAPKAPDTRAGVVPDRAARPEAPVQANRTGIEPTAHRSEADTAGDREQLHAEPAGPDDFLNLSGDAPRTPTDHDVAPHDGVDRSGVAPANDRTGLPADHNDSPGDHNGSPHDRAGTPTEHPDAPGFVAIPVDTPPPADRAARPADQRTYEPAAAGPVGDFHGTARPEGDLTLQVVHGKIADFLHLMTPEGMSWNPDKGHFVLSDGRIVRIEVGETSEVPGTGKRNVAEFVPSEHGFDVRVSNKARTDDVVRALAHELAEIRLAQDDPIPYDLHEDRPTRLTPQLGGRFAELRTLTAHIDRATMDPASAHELPGLRRDLHDLMNHLGFHDPAHAPTVERLLAEHDPLLTHRLELERAGVLAERPTFDRHLTEEEFQHAAEQHLDRLRELLTGPHVDDLVRVEEHALNGRMREELSRRVFERLFEDEAKPARKQVPGLFKAIDPINAAINHPTLRGPEQAAAIHRAIDAFHDGMPQAARDALGADRFADMHAAADAFETAPDRITGVIDHTTGRMEIGGEHTTLADFLHGIDRANRAAAENGLNAEYAVILHDAVDGRHTVEVLSRPQPQHRLPLEQYRFGDRNRPIEPQPRPSIPAAAAGGHTIDVGVGRGAFAVEMTPAADRAGGGLVIKTELTDAAIGGQRRRDLGILDAGPLMEPGTVMVYGDMLGNGHLLGGDIARVFINNVSAKLPDAAYRAIAEHLSEIMAPGGRIEVQWDMKPDKIDGDPGSRHHILGTKLWEALEKHYQDADGGNPFELVERTNFEQPGNGDYYYTIDAGSSNDLPHERMADYSPPQPEHRWTISYEPHASGTPEHAGPESVARPHETDPEHGTASPVGEFRGDARPADADPLTRESVVDKIEGKLPLIEPEDVAWNHDQSRFELEHDGRTIDITLDVGPTRDNAVAEFTWRTNESGDITGYDIRVSPHARDEDVVRAVAHELAEIRLEMDDRVLTERVDDRPGEMTSHLGGRFAELRVLIEEIGEGVAARAKPHVMAPLRRDLNDLMYHLGLHDAEHAPTVERLLARHDPDLARLIDQARIPDPGILRPGPIDHDATPSPHDLGRIRQLRELSERMGEDHDATRREALRLVEQLGLREGTPGAAQRREIIAEHLTPHTRDRVEELLADVGRRDTELSATDREHVETVRLELRAADALDFLSIPTHGAVLKTHIVYRTEMAEHLAQLHGMATHATTPEAATTIRPLGDHHTVEDVRTGERWFRWPPSTEEYPDHTPIPDVGLPTDPDHRLPADPQQLHEAWQSLSPAEKDAWHEADPFIGNRDGIPHVDRDHYNRQTLDMLHEQAVRDGDADRLAIIEDMKKYLDMPIEEGQPAVHLSYLDEKLQYAYALGDPDHARHVVVEIAGAFRRRSGVGYALETLAQVRQAALAVDAGAETSVILFGAYNNPNSLIQAMHSGHAEAGAAKVREFHDGLRVTHQGPPANITTLAHSYGAVTAGHAAGHGHELNTDALVFIGSFGTGVHGVGDLRLTGVDPAETPNHVFATLAEYDSLVMMPPTHGPAPTDPEFGARVFESATQPSPTRLGWNPDDHGGKNYFSDRHRSYRNLGRIIVGRPDLLD